jgi:hypothetical protein
MTISTIVCSALAPIFNRLCNKKQQHDQQQINQPAVPMEPQALPSTLCGCQTC